MYEHVAHIFVNICDVIKQNESGTGKYCLRRSLCLYWAAQFKNHTPLWKIYCKFLTGGVWFSNGLAYWATPFESHTPSVQQFGYVLQWVWKFHVEVSSGLFHLKLLLPVWMVYGKSFTEGVWISNRVAHLAGLVLCDVYVSLQDKKIFFWKSCQNSRYLSSLWCFWQTLCSHYFCRQVLSLPLIWSSAKHAHLK